MYIRSRPAFSHQSVWLFVAIAVVSLVVGGILIFRVYKLHSGEHYQNSYSLHRRGQTCTTTTNQSIATSLNTHNQVNGNRRPPIRYVVAPECQQNRPIITQHVRSMRGFSSAANKEFSTAQSHLHNVKIRHHQQGKVLEATKVRQDQALHRLRGQKQLSNASFSPEPSTAVDTPFTRYNQLKSRIDSQQLEISRLQNKR